MEIYIRISGKQGSGKTILAEHLWKWFREQGFGGVLNDEEAYKQEPGKGRGNVVIVTQQD